VERGSFLHTVASTVQTLAFDHLDAPVVAPNRITPAPELEGDFFPQPSWIVDAIQRADRAAARSRERLEPDRERDRATRTARCVRVLMVS